MFRFRAHLPDIALEPPQESALSSEYSKTHGREALRFEPRRFLRSIEDAPRHIILGMDAARSVRPMSAAEARTVLIVYIGLYSADFLRFTLLTLRMLRLCLCPYHLLLRMR